MLKSLRARTSDEGGFTLIELLVVVLIIGILSAIAIPAFLSQTSKASDSAAKTQVGTLQTTMQAYATEHNGEYAEKTAALTLTELQKIEPGLNDTSQAEPLVVSVTGSTGFSVSSKSVSTKDVFTLTNTNGSIARTCTVNNTSSPGGCKLTSGSSGTW